MKIDKIKVGTRIHDLRVSKNWSMDEFATKINVSGKSTVNEWEKGRSIPNQHTLEQISTVYSTTINYLLYGDFSQYVFDLLNNDGTNNNEFNTVIWEYINATTNTEDMLAGVPLENGNPVDEHTEKLISDQIASDAIASAIKKNMKDILTQLKKDKRSYGDEIPIIQTAIAVLRKNVAFVNQTFEGKVHQLIRKFDSLDSFEYLSSSVTLKEYLQKNHFGEHVDDPRSVKEQRLDSFYQAQLNSLMMKFNGELYELLNDYHAEQYKLENTNK